jgi:hypothetical protein
MILRVESNLRGAWVVCRRLAWSWLTREAAKGLRFSDGDGGGAVNPIPRALPKARNHP